MENEVHIVQKNARSRLYWFFEGKKVIFELGPRSGSKSGFRSISCMIGVSLDSNCVDVSELT